MFIVHIKNNKTGEIRQWIEKDLDWFGSGGWMWTEGNYGCDCNRAIYFARAKGEDETQAWGQKCGDGVDYSVPFVELENGEQVKVE